METLTISTKKTSADAGERISRELAGYLINGFKEKFPREKAAIFIAKETIRKAVEHIDDLTGIRFMYGFEAVNNGESRILSRVLVLKPCRNVSENSIPEAIVPSSGYTTDTGANISHQESRQILYNHTARFSRYFPDLAFDKIMRGTFIGINNLRPLLEIEGCIGINFNFGYDDATWDFPEKNKPVFEAINSGGECLDMFGITPPCPNVCGLGDIFNL